MPTTSPTAGRPSIHAWLLTTTLACGAACAPDRPLSFDGGMQAPDAGLPGHTIGPAGGRITFDEGPLAGVERVFPPGALPNAVALTVDTAEPLPLDNWTVLGQALRIGPMGTTFAGPVFVTMPFDPDAIPVGGQPSEVWAMRGFAANGGIDGVRPFDVDVRARRVRFSALWASVLEIAIPGPLDSGNIFVDPPEIEEGGVTMVVWRSGSSLVSSCNVDWERTPDVSALPFPDDTDETHFGNLIEGVGGSWPASARDTTSDGLECGAKDRPITTLFRFVELRVHHPDGGPPEVPSWARAHVTRFESNPAVVEAGVSLTLSWRLTNLPGATCTIDPPVGCPAGASTAVGVVSLLVGTATPGLLRVTPPGIVLPVGARVPFHAFARFGNEEYEVTELATWSSGDPEVMTVGDSAADKGWVAVLADHPTPVLLSGSFGGLRLDNATWSQPAGAPVTCGPRVGGCDDHFVCSHGTCLPCFEGPADRGCGGGSTCVNGRCVR